MEEIYPCPELAGSLAAAANNCTGSKRKHLCVILSSRLVKFTLRGNSVKQRLYGKRLLIFIHLIIAGWCCFPPPSPITVHTEECSTSTWGGIPQDTGIVLLSMNCFHLCSREIFSITSLFSLNTRISFSWILLTWDQQGNAERAPELPNKCSLRYSPAMGLLPHRKQ